MVCLNVSDVFNERIGKYSLRAIIYILRTTPGPRIQIFLGALEENASRERRDDAQKGRQADPYGRPGATGVRDADDTNDTDERQFWRGRERLLQRVHAV